MPVDLDLFMRLRACYRGRAVRKAARRRVLIQPHAHILTLLAMAGEDTTVHIALWGKPGAKPEVYCVPDPRYRDDQYELFRWLAVRISRYYDECRREQTHPQIWVSSGAAQGHLDILADRLRYNQHDADVRRLGELLTYAAERHPVAGQQALHTAAEALSLHYATGQQASEDQHLGALLAWIAPPRGVDVHAAVAAAEREPMGVKTDPEFDRLRLEPLVRTYNAERRGAARPTVLAGFAAEVERELRPVAERIYRATGRAVLHLHRISLRPLSSLAALERREVEAFLSFMDARDAGYHLPLRDKPKPAAFKLVEREDAVQNVGLAVMLEDDYGMAGAIMTGHIVIGCVEGRPVRTRLAPRHIVHVFTLLSDQPSLHLRPGDELRWADDPRFVVRCEGVHRAGGVTRVRLALIHGMRSVGPPDDGQPLVLLPGVPDWDWIWRTRGQMKRRLDAAPWTHDPAASPPALPPHPSSVGDPLAAVRALRLTA